MAPIIEARTNVAVSNWRDAVRAACAPLVAAGAVEYRYVDRCIDSALENGPYIVLAPHIAFAHARPEDGVRHLCLAAATLSEPVDFGHRENDPVDLVFAFGSPDREQHVGLLSALAEQLTNGLDGELRQADEQRANELLKGVVGKVA